MCYIKTTEKNYWFFIIFVIFAKIKFSPDLYVLKKLIYVVQAYPDAEFTIIAQKERNERKPSMMLVQLNRRFVLYLHH